MNRARTFTPRTRIGWWGGLDGRTRCDKDGKVVFESLERAQRSADLATNKGHKMKPYKGNCQHWHVTTK